MSSDDFSVGKDVVGDRADRTREGARTGYRRSGLGADDVDRSALRRQSNREHTALDGVTQPLHLVRAHLQHPQSCSRYHFTYGLPHALISLISFLLMLENLLEKLHYSLFLEAHHQKISCIHRKPMRQIHLD